MNWLTDSLGDLNDVDGIPAALHVLRPISDLQIGDFTIWNSFQPIKSQQVNVFLVEIAVHIIFGEKTSQSS